MKRLKWKRQMSLKFIKFVALLLSVFFFIIIILVISFLYYLSNRFSNYVYSTQNTMKQVIFVGAKYCDFQQYKIYSFKVQNIAISHGKKYTKIYCCVILMFMIIFFISVLFPLCIICGVWVNFFLAIRKRNPPIFASPPPPLENNRLHGFNI